MAAYSSRPEAARKLPGLSHALFCGGAATVRRHTAEPLPAYHGNIIIAFKIAGNIFRDIETAVVGH